MSRDITIRDMQKVIANMHAYCETTICPGWAKSIVKHMAMLLEDILCNQDASQPNVQDGTADKCTCDGKGGNNDVLCPKHGQACYNPPSA